MRFVPSIKLYRKLRFRKGYGVHSPFAFNLITKVIEERAQFYVFDEIENFRSRLFDARQKEIETQHRNYGALLFRLVNYFDCRNILQIRGLSGIMSLYLAEAKNNCSCYVFEENSDFTEAVKRFAELRNLSNLHFLEGDYGANIAKLKSENSSFDLVFINQAGNAAATAATVGLTRAFYSERTVLVIDGIYSNKDMQTFWQTLVEHPETCVTVDLYALGLVFFNPKLNKQHYKTYFDYGKKQNLYRQRRRGFHFAGWRKKRA
jgi:predicted O-methyltransferase YrrM